MEKFSFFLKFHHFWTVSGLRMLRPLSVVYDANWKHSTVKVSTQKPTCLNLWWQLQFYSLTSFLNLKLKSDDFWHWKMDRKKKLYRWLNWTKLQITELAAIRKIGSQLLGLSRSQFSSIDTSDWGSVYEISTKTFRDLRTGADNLKWRSKKVKYYFVIKILFKLKLKL